MLRTYFALLLLCLCVTLTFPQKARKQERSLRVDKKKILIQKYLDRLHLQEERLEAELQDLNENGVGDDFEESYQECSAPPIYAAGYERTPAHSMDQQRLFSTWLGELILSPEPWMLLIFFMIIKFFYKNAREQNVRISSLERNMQRFQNKIKVLEQMQENQKWKLRENENLAIEAANKRNSFGLLDIISPIVNFFVKR